MFRPPRWLLCCKGKSREAFPEEGGGEGGRGREEGGKKRGVDVLKHRQILQ